MSFLLGNLLMSKLIHDKNCLFLVQLFNDLICFLSFSLEKRKLFFHMWYAYEFKETANTFLCQIIIQILSGIY